MKKKFISMCSLILVFLLPACTTLLTPVPQQTTPVAQVPTPEYVPEGAVQDAILVDSDVFIQDIVTGISTNDYTTFAKDFDAVMSNSLKETEFGQVYDSFGPLGVSEKIELYNVQVAGDYYAVRYKVTYPKKIIIIRVVVDKNDPRKVSGLWFE